MSTTADSALQQQVSELIRAETRYLNQADLANWISLFTEDGYLLDAT